MPLIRMMGRTAVIAGTATAVSGRVARRQNQKWAAQEEQQAPPPQYQAPPPPPQYQAPAPPPPPPPDPIEKLKQLAELHEQGVLTDEEFASEKAKVLNG